MIIAHCSLDLTVSKMRSHYVAQAGLEILDTSCSPILASQSAEIPGVSHHAQPIKSNCYFMPKLEKSLLTLYIFMCWGRRERERNRQTDRQGVALLPRLYSGMITAHSSLDFWGQSDPPASAS
ncbi:Protein PPP5D1 [Plecturocebus cupreus]